MKGLVVHHGLALRKTHDLEELLDILAPALPQIDGTVYDEALKIKNYAVGIRYPDEGDDPSEEEVAEAIATADFFRNFVVRFLDPNLFS